jgi:hypothetical protein
LANEAATTKTKLDSAQAELTRRKRDMPTSASEHKAFEEALSALATAVEERKGRANRGKAKAADRTHRRKELFAELRKSLEAAEAEAERQELECATQHEQRGAQLAALENSTTLALQKMATEAGQKAAAEAAKKETDDSQQPAASLPQDPTAALAQAQQMFQRQTQSLQEEQTRQIAEMQRPLYRYLTPACPSRYSPADSHSIDSQSV